VRRSVSLMAQSRGCKSCQPYWCITNISQETPSRSIPYVPPIGIDLFRSIPYIPPIGIDLFRSTGGFLTYSGYAPVGLMSKCGLDSLSSHTMNIHSAPDCSHSWLLAGHAVRAAEHRLRSHIRILLRSVDQLLGRDCGEQVMVAFN
jgi:hypothetical protein